MPNQGTGDRSYAIVLSHDISNIGCGSADAAPAGRPFHDRGDASFGICDATMRFFFCEVDEEREEGIPLAAFKHREIAFAKALAAAPASNV